MHDTGSISHPANDLPLAVQIIDHGIITTEISQIRHDAMIQQQIAPASHIRGFEENDAGKLEMESGLHLLSHRNHSVVCNFWP